MIELMLIIVVLFFIIAYLLYFVIDEHKDIEYLLKRIERLSE